MDPATKIAFGPVDTGALRRRRLPRGVDDLRTLLQRYLLDRVLPMLTLLSMSAVTTVTIVLVVTAVANAGWHLPARPVGMDPSAGWYFGPASMYEGQAGELMPGDFIDSEPWERVQAEAGEAPVAALSRP